MLKLNRHNYICALDIGSSKIAACVAQIKRKQVSSILFESLPVKGVRRGQIVDSLGLVNCISRLIQALSEQSGINIKSVYANISGKDISTKNSRAIVPLAERGNKVITISDLRRVIEQARILGSSLEEEIINFTPSGFTIDSKSNVSNPLGLYSHRLEVDLYLVCGKFSSIQSLSRTINQAGLGLNDLFFSGLATSRAVFNQELKDGLNIFCDIGSDTTEILFFKDGLIRDIEILSCGGDDFTSALQEELKIPFELAEDIKRSYGVIGDPASISDEKEILVKKSDLYKPIKQKLVAEIIAASSRALCAKIKEAVEKKASSHHVHNFVCAGRAMLLEGFIETLETTLNIPVKLGRINNPQIPPAVKQDQQLAGQKYLVYLSCLGVLCEALQGETLGLDPVAQPAKNPILKAVNRFKEVYQEYF